MKKRVKQMDRRPDRHA